MLAPQLVIPDSQFVTERRWFRMHPVRAANHHRIAICRGLPADNREELVEAGQQHVGRCGCVQRKRRVDDIRAGQSDVDESRVRADALTGCAQESDHVMIDFLLDVLFIHWSIWVGTGLGILAAYVAWIYLPESADRESICALIVIAAFLGSFACAAILDKKKKTERNFSPD